MSTTSNLSNIKVMSQSNFANLSSTDDDKLYFVETQAYITETYHNGASWYRVWSDGFIEQGGKVTGAAYNASGVNVTFLKSFSNANYIVNVAALEGANYINGAWTNNMSSSQMLVKTGGQNKANHLLAANWYACGY